MKLLNLAHPNLRAITVSLWPQYLPLSVLPPPKGRFFQNQNKTHFAVNRWPVRATLPLFFQH
jgi:hypothetical protein